MLKSLLFTGSLVFCLGVHGQSIQRQSIGTMGKTYHGDEISLQQSVGQSYQTHSYYSNEVQSRPGFIQPSQFAIEFINSTFKIELTVYPNPATSEVHFSTNENLENLTVQVYDQSGKVIFSNFIEELRNYKLSCNDWENGVYFIHLKDQSNNIYQSKLIKN